MKSRSRDGLAAKGLFYLNFIALRDKIKAGADLVRTITSSCYRSCAHGQGLLCLQLRTDEAKGSIQ